MFKKLLGKQKNRTDKKSPTQCKPFPAKLEDAKATIKDIYHFPLNEDVVIRDLDILSLKKKASLVTIKSLGDMSFIERSIIQPLLNNSNGIQDITDIVTVPSVKELQTIEEAIIEMNSGNAILLIDGQTSVYAFSTSKLEGRSVERAEIEVTLKGPKEAFTEKVMTNINLVRQKMKNENLIFESSTVAKRANNELYIAYLKDVANEELLDQVRNRIKKLDPAMLQNLALLEEYISDHPYSMFPTVLYTERPDRATTYLNDGHIIIFMENSPSCLVLAATLWSFIHSPDDQYLRFLYGNFIRLLRAISVMITLFASSAYVAITTFHASMIPPDLLLAIASTREKVPFPAFFEVVLMELAFELIREAGLRVPAPIGPTIGIVGALILGQSAVQANIVSPIVVIAVALGGLSSFVINDVSMNFAIRLSRFIFISAAGFFGVFGITAAMAVILLYLAALKTFGVPYLAPLTPKYGSSNNIIFRRLAKKELFRPEYIEPKDKQKEEETK